MSAVARSLGGFDGSRYSKRSSPLGRELSVPPMVSCPLACRRFSPFSPSLLIDAPSGTLRVQPVSWTMPASAPVAVPVACSLPKVVICWALRVTVPASCALSSVLPVERPRPRRAFDVRVAAVAPALAEAARPGEDVVAVHGDVARGDDGDRAAVADAAAGAGVHVGAGGDVAAQGVELDVAPVTTVGADDRVGGEGPAGAHGDLAAQPLEAGHRGDRARDARVAVRAHVDDAAVALGGIAGGVDRSGEHDAAVREQVDLARVQVGRYIDRTGAVRARLDPYVAAGHDLDAGAGSLRRAAEESAAGLDPHAAGEDRHR